MNPFERGREDYKNGVGCFDNPFFGTGDLDAVKEWARGWGTEQVARSKGGAK